VFGRSEDFDSQSDSVVRVHTGRLRSKLAEYYMSEGVDDELIITIPKGIYALSWHSRHLSPPASVPHITETVATEPVLFPASPAHPSVPVAPPPVVVPQAGARVVSLRTCILIVAMAVLCTLLGSSLVRQKAASAAAPAGLKTFWRPFIGAGEEPLIVFSNFRFTGSIPAGLKKYDRALDTDKPVIDTYTTMGEVMGVFQVGTLLSGWNQPVRAKRSRLLTWDEAKDRNLIFVGGPLAETPLRDVPVLKDLQFQDGPTSPVRKAGGVLNLHPGKNEQPIYVGSDTLFATPGGLNSGIDYAVIALRPGLTPNHYVLVLAGITEFGTQGAADFVTHEDRVNELLSRIHSKQGAPQPWFEALLRVQIEGGVPIQSSIVLIHQTS
jgi:hypothetical protein